MSATPPEVRVCEKTGMPWSQEELFLLEAAILLNQPRYQDAAATIHLLRNGVRKLIFALPEHSRFDKKYIDIDQAAGSTYELHLKPWIRELLTIAGEDPNGYE